MPCLNHYSTSITTTMARSTIQPPRWRSALNLLTIILFALPVHSLYFYIDGTTPKCFYEELPKDTLVVGPSPPLPIPTPIRPSSPANPSPAGHYKADQYDAATNAFSPNPDLGIAITVDETFDNDHRVVSQRGSSAGRFTFSAADSGDHKICFTTSSAAATGGWLSSGYPVGGVRLNLDLAIGETSAIESTDKGKIQDIVQKVKDLNARLQDIRREQVFQRVSFWDVGWAVFDLGGGLLMCVCVLGSRSERRSLGISRRRRIRGWCGGRSCSWLCSVLRARGSCRICALSSSSRSLREEGWW